MRQFAASARRHGTALALVALLLGADRVASELRKYMKVYFLTQVECIYEVNDLHIPGPCPDAHARAIIGKSAARVHAALAATCSAEDLAALGYGSDCRRGADVPTGVQAACAALPLADGADLARCLLCWQDAWLGQYMAFTYASHAVDLCGGVLDDTSPTCMPLPCPAPLPDQRNLSDPPEDDCQRGIGRATTKFIMKRQQVLDACALSGRTRSDCLADPRVRLVLDTKLAQFRRVFARECEEQRPVLSSPFCCRCAVGGMCIDAADRPACEAAGCDVLEDFSCEAGACARLPQPVLTWWTHCPEGRVWECPGVPLASLDDMMNCIGSGTVHLVEELLCLRFPGAGDWCL
jgi:hypothetical protein